YSLQNDDVQKIIEQPSVQQPHLLVKLVKQYGYETPTKSAGRLLVDAGLQIVTVGIESVVNAVHQCGGVCLIAHPGRGDGYVKFDEALLDQLRSEVPIDGLRSITPHIHQNKSRCTRRMRKNMIYSLARGQIHTHPISHLSNTLLGIAVSC
ncbi:MAG TPA: hypothetical protein PLZ51_12110, partial [Aggregatilineales bacterium]|nr:hypothetical protein [Aggregatilineales bacterium]